MRIKMNQISQYKVLAQRNCISELTLTREAAHAPLLSEYRFQIFGGWFLGFYRLLHGL